MANQLPENQENRTLRQKIHDIIFGADTWSGMTFDILLLMAIVCSIIILSLETVEGLGWTPGPNGEHITGEQAGTWGTWIHWLKWFFTVLFTLEYLLRIFCVKRPTRYIFSFWGIIDLLSFLPDYLLLAFPGASSYGFAVIRSLRLMRAFRILKLGWFQNEAEDLGDAIYRARAKIVVFLTAVMILVTVTGTVMYEIERAFEPERTQFDSIPDGIYWAIVTMTTVGFGDIVPVTIPGKFLSAFLILVGYSLIIVPTGFVTAEVLDRNMKKKVTVISCQSCVTEGHDKDARYCKYCGELM